MTWRRGAWIAGATLAVAASVLVGTRFWASDEPPADPRAFCERVRQFREAVDGLGRGPESADQVGDARDAAALVAETARGLATAAPDEIEADVETMADASETVAEELRKFYAEVMADPDLAQDAGYLASFEIDDREQAAAEEAATRVRPWVEQHCGITLAPAEPVPDVG